jgi:IS30 family transposase
MGEIIKEKMVANERIYQYVLKDKQSGVFLFKHVRTGQKIQKKRYGSKDQSGVIPNEISMDDRPESLQNKERA